MTTNKNLLHDGGVFTLAMKNQTKKKKSSQPINHVSSNVVSCVGSVCRPYGYVCVRRVNEYSSLHIVNYVDISRSLLYICYSFLLFLFYHGY